MEFRTIVDVALPDFRIAPCEEMLFVGSCFADSIGRRFAEDKFAVTVNPYGVMYNPASVLHTVERWMAELDAQGKAFSASTVFMTLGTNHVYRLKETGEIVDNCQKRPQSLFTEEELPVSECFDYLAKAVRLLREKNPEVRVVMTVSPIRYRKYGFHESQLSKATLLLAVHQMVQTLGVTYFPAYEIVNDELRDYRFYQADMLHPSDQAVEYIWQRFAEAYLSDEAKKFLEEWRPLKAALAHRPFQPDSDEYRAFMEKTMLKTAALRKKYPNMTI